MHTIKTVDLITTLLKVTYNTYKRNVFLRQINKGILNDVNKDRYSELLQSRWNFPPFVSIMDDALKRDSFSYPYKILIYLGNWPYDGDSPIKRKLFRLYGLIGTIYEWHLVLIGWIDLYLSLNDFKRVVYNLCVTFSTTTISVKNRYFLVKPHAVNKFRLQLYLYMNSLAQDDEAVNILNRYRYSLKVWKWILYTCVILVTPLWLLSSLLSLKWGPRELPFPIWLPLELDDDYQFGLGFVYHTMAVFIYLARAVHVELAMFSLVLQTTGLYRVLGKDLMKINDFYANKTDYKRDKKKDINKFLTRVRVKKDLRSLLRRQMEMKGCVKVIEYFLYMPMLFQLFGGLLISVTNGFELIEATLNFSFKLSYQIGYTIVVLTDLFLWCYFSDFLMLESEKINNILYDLTWYEMEIDIRKDIMLMLTASQRIDRLTVGKFFTLNLSTFLGVIKNLYSWLTVFRTVAQKR